jgi:hypothetical protein
MKIFNWIISDYAYVGLVIFLFSFTSNEMKIEKLPNQ